MSLNIHWEYCFDSMILYFRFFHVLFLNLQTPTTITGRRWPTSADRVNHGDRPPYDGEPASIGGPMADPPPGHRRRSLVWTCPRVGRLFRRHRRPLEACRMVGAVVDGEQYGVLVPPTCDNYGAPGTIDATDQIARSNCNTLACRLTGAAKGVY